MKDIQFKVHGMNRLVTFEELKLLPTKFKTMPIRVVCLKDQRSWKSCYTVILEKFR